jgi:CubicO group peptidase (beta-lactamase class C family)
MKKQLLSACAALMVLLFFSVALQAQTDYSGTWKGAIEIPGTNLELSIHLSKDGGKWSGTLDIPLQHVKDMKLADLALEGDALRFKLPEVPGNASYAGKFDAKAEKLSGTFTQGGQALPMNLQRESMLQQAAEAKRLADAISKLRRLSDSLVLKRHTPGLAFGIVKNGKILMADGFGYRNLEKKLPVTANTQFAIGSSTKAFTTMALAMLADQGKLDWDKPVIQYMPDFKMYDDFSTAEINAIDLTCHRSGLPRHDMIWYGSDFTRKNIYDRLRYLKPNKPLRTTWQYNNLMFMTAGYLVERISGQTWEDFVKTNVFKPLGMQNSNFSVKDLVASKEPATGYATKNEKNTRMEYRNIDAMGPAGSINSTVNDMLKWVKLHLDDSTSSAAARLISESELHRLHTPQMLMDQDAMAKNPELTDPAYGFGWFIYRHKGLKVVEHGGNIDGFSALIYMVPEKDFGLVILTNQNGAGIPAVLSRYATDMVLGLDYTDWYLKSYGKEDKKEEKKEDKKPEQNRVAGTQPSHALAGYVGEYEHPGYGTIEIVADGPKLKMKFHTLELPLEHWHYDNFHGTDTTLEIDFALSFHTDQNGNIDQLTSQLDPLSDDAIFTKIAPHRLSDPAFLQKLTGKYKMDDEDMTVKFELRNTTLVAIVAGQPTYTLVPFQGNEFKLKGLNGYSVEFKPDENGKVNNAAFNQPNGVFKIKRVE